MMSLLRDKYFWCLIVIKTTRLEKQPILQQIDQIYRRKNLSKNAKISFCEKELKWNADFCA